MKAFCEPATSPSIPHSSIGIGSAPTAVIPSTSKIVSGRARVIAAISLIGCRTPELVSHACVQTARVAGLAQEIGEWLNRPRAEALREGFRVVLAGPPNAGKSSLFNALIED